MNNLTIIIQFKKDKNTIKNMLRHVTLTAFTIIDNHNKILGLQPRDKVAMLEVNTIEFFLKEFT